MILHLLLLLQMSSSLCQNTGVRCLSCYNAKTPEHCDNWVICGRGEICYAREITNFHGEQAFHLGCDDKARCDLFSNAKILIGKRDLGSNPDESSPTEEWDEDRCYQCCVRDDCNSRLCYGYTKVSTNNSSFGPRPSSCPPTFVKGPGDCYFFGNWSVSWDSARQDCRRRGADLVSVDSQAEQDFLEQHLNNTDPNVLSKTGYWLGGFYVYALKEYVWLDMKPFTFTSWAPSQPSTSSYDYRVSLHPIGKTGDWGWSVQTHSTNQGFICERDFV